jgi:hypothetical protein
MMGTFGGALQARHIDASNGKLTADVTGEVEAEDSVLVIRRIHVAMRLVAPEVVRETVERTHGIYAMHCPLYRTLHKTIQLTSSFELRARVATSWKSERRRGQYVSDHCFASSTFGSEAVFSGRTGSSVTSSIELLHAIVTLSVRPLF